MNLNLINISYDCRQNYPRGTPTACLVDMESPYIVLLGGVNLNPNSIEVCNYIECFNLETLEWFSLNHYSGVGLGFQAHYSG